MNGAHPFFRRPAAPVVMHNPPRAPHFFPVPVLRNPAEALAPAQPSAIVPVMPAAQREEAARAQAQVIEQRFSGLKDRMQLAPMMSCVKFTSDDDGIIRSGRKRKSFVDDEGQGQASGIIQHAANSTFGGSTTHDESWMLHALGVFYWADGPRELSDQERRQIAWKLSGMIKRSAGTEQIGPIAAWPAGDVALDYERFRRFDSPVELGSQKHFTMEFEVREDIFLVGRREILVYPVFPGAKYVNPADRAAL